MSSAPRVILTRSHEIEVRLKQDLEKGNSESLTASTENDKTLIEKNSDEEDTLDFDSDDTYVDPTYCVNSDSESCTSNNSVDKVQNNEVQDFPNDNKVTRELESSVQPCISDVQPSISDFQPSISDVQPSISDVGKKLVTKKNCCYYCNKLVTKIARHFITVHKDETLVKKILSRPVGSPQRKELIEKLRIDGNYIYNKNPNTLPAAMVLTRRTRKTNITKDHYLPCSECNVYISSLSLKRHFRRFHRNNKNLGLRDKIRGARGNASQFHEVACDVLKFQVLPVLRIDDVYKAIRFDKLIMIYGNKMCDKYRDKHHYEMIRARLRLAGRFLLGCKRIDSSIDDFISVFDPLNYNTVLQVIKTLGCLNEETGHYSKPTIPTNLYTFLKYTGSLLISETIKDRNYALKSLTEEFLHLIATDLPTLINKAATESLLHFKRQKKVVLPTTGDIKKLNNFLIKQRQIHYGNLLKEFKKHDWLKLLQYTLASVLLFNRRRPGELERTLIDDYKNCQSVNEETNKEIYDSLSAEDKRIANMFVRFTVRGKLARGVPVLLNSDMQMHIDHLLANREAAGVDSNNRYLFGIPSSNDDGGNKYLRAYWLIRTFSKQCGANIPESLRATQLRKHIATKSVLLNLQESEVTNLQNFLGHADKIHKQYYRQPIITQDITNMSKLLSIAQGDHEGNEDEENEMIEIEQENVEIREEENNETDGDSQEKQKSRVVILENRLITSANRETSIKPETSTKQTTSTKRATSIKRTTSIKRGTSTKRMTSSKLMSSPKPMTSSKEILISTKQKRRRLLDDCIKSKSIKRTWTTPERHCAKMCFEENIVSKNLPSNTEVLDIIMEHVELQERTIPQVKTWVANEINRRARNQSAPATGIRKKSWTTPERATLRKLFKANIENKTYPTTEELLYAIKNNPQLKARTPKRMKSQIQHLMRMPTTKEHVKRKLEY